MIEIMNRVRGLLSRAFVSKVNDSGGLQYARVQFSELESSENIVRIQPYGLSTVPDGKNESVVLCVNGVRGQSIIIAVDDSSSRPRNRAPGETVLYSKKGATISLLDIVKIEADKVEIKCNEFNVNSGALKVT